MSKTAIKTLFNEISQETKTGRRDLTMFILMYNTATRIHEILSLRLQDIHIDVEKPYVSIIGKGRKI